MLKKLISWFEVLGWNRLFTMWKFLLWGGLKPDYFSNINLYGLWEAAGLEGNI
jgi:hypothetical protein